MSGGGANLELVDFIFDKERICAIVRLENAVFALFLFLPHHTFPELRIVFEVVHDLVVEVNMRNELFLVVHFIS